MARKHKPVEIIGKLREAEIVLAQGGTVADACRRIGVTEQSYYRWHKEYGGLKMDQARRMNGWYVFKPILAGANLKDRLISCFGALFGIGATAFICLKVAGPISSPWLVAPLGASAVLLFAVPASPLSQPWPIIGGNVLSAMVGVVAVQAISSTPIAAAVAVGGAILVMSLLRCLHPPGGAAALTAVIGGKSIADLGFAFPLIPMGLNSVLLVLTGLLFHRMSGHSYPHRVLPAASVSRDNMQPFDVQTLDIDLALEDLGEVFDIGREDLEELFKRVEHHARRRRAGSD